MPGAVLNRTAPKFCQARPECGLPTQQVVVLLTTLFTRLPSPLRYPYSDAFYGSRRMISVYPAHLKW